MDIALNIINNTNFIQKREKSPPRKMKKSKEVDGGFSFTFTNNKSAKAVVARRRVNKPVEKSIVKESPPQKLNPKKKLQRPKNYVLRPPDSSDDDVQPQQDIEPEINLSLNVRKGTDGAAVIERKKKPTREERLKKNKNKREGQPNKVFTQEEINEGIKKFSQLPQGKPKVKKTPLRKENLFKNNPETKIIGQRFVKPLTEKVFTGASIGSLNLHPHCVKNLEDILNITELTLVQQRTIPEALKGRDILVRSQTGSGKTLAYALPVVQKLQEMRPKLTRDCGIQAVIIVPIRELALQTYELLIKLLKPFTWIVSGYLTGGERRKAEKARLRKGINILVGTPGRLVDHLLHTETFKLDQVKFLVLDEADRLLEMGYERDVKKIVEAINQHKLGNFNVKEVLEGDVEISKVTTESASDLQRLLLSATLTSAVQKLAGLTLRNPLFIDTSDEDPTNFVKNTDTYDALVQDAVEDGKMVIPATVQLTYIVVHPKLRLVTLSGLLAKECLEKKVKALVFMPTIEIVNYHHDLMNEQLTKKIIDDEEQHESEEDDDEPLLKGLRFFKLHGSMTQQERSGVFKDFRSVKSGVLLATDVAGRGIDVPEVDLVVQYTPPQNIPEFVQRVGRTGRAGRSGRAILFLGPTETDFVRILEDKRIRIAQGDAEQYIKVLHDADTCARTSQEAASNLQHKFDELLREDREMYDKACKAFVSWVRFYSTFPKELKEVFNVKTAHMGHYAKSFGLRDPPKSFVKRHTTPKAPLPTNRLTYTERDPEKIKIEKRARKRSAGTTVASSNRFNKFLPKSVMLTTSEFDSGLPAIKKKKKN